MNNVINSFEFVDLGLPSGTLWATCNLGATKPEEFGDYYMWGSVTPNTNTSCDWASAPFNGGQSLFSTAIFRKASGTTCPSGILTPEYDAATQNLGGKWRMPTDEEWKELVYATNTKWTSMYGIKGKKFTAPNGKSIFLPASGCRHKAGLYNQGSNGYYWSSSLNVSSPGCAWHMAFDIGSQHFDWFNIRSYGFNIRPVMSKN